MRASIKTYFFTDLKENEIMFVGVIPCGYPIAFQKIGVQTLVWQNQAKAWTPTKIFI